MGYGGGWGLWSGAQPKPAAFCERGWQRKALAAWDARWQKLSVPARSALLADVKAPPQRYAAGSPNAGTPANKFRPEVLKELTAAGFIRVEPAPNSSKPDRVIAVADVSEFRVRVRALQRIGLLNPREPGGLTKFINVACYPSRLVGFVSGVLRDAGLEINLSEQAAHTYLTSARWPDLALKAIKDPVAAKVLDAVRKSEKPVPIDDLPNRVKKVDADKVRAAVDKLVSHLAVFEDLNARTFAIEVGLLPAVRDRMAAAAARADRPALVACPSPRELGPDGGPLIDDLRALLLEVASDPPRLRQDGEIFSKEKDRFYEALAPLPAWFSPVMKADAEGRLDSAYSESLTLKLVKDQGEGKELRLQLTPRGKAWLTAETKDQYAQVYDGFRATPKRESPYYIDNEFDDYVDPYTARWYGYYASSVLNDRTFLGSTVAVVAPRTGKGEKKSVTPTAKDVEALREAIGRAFLELPEGAYHRLDGLVEYLAFRDKNVILLGYAQEAIRVYDKGHPVPALEEAREETGRKALKELVLTRLIPLGALRAAVDVEGKLCVARTPRLSAYFGFGPMPDLAGAGAGEGSKVVVQPDFSVVVIGLSTAALAELAPFCERTGRGSTGPGASVLKLTKESVTRAIGQGLKPQQIVDRLTRHASHEPPANVVRQVRDWGAWVKPVSTARLTVLRCPDRDAADRVVGVLKGRVERLNDTTLALDAEKLLPADRKKLRDNGILLDASAPGATPKARKKVAARRRSY